MHGREIIPAFGLEQSLALVVPGEFERGVEDHFDAVVVGIHGRWNRRRAGTCEAGKRGQSGMALVQAGFSE